MLSAISKRTEILAFTHKHFLANTIFAKCRSKSQSNTQAYKQRLSEWCNMTDIGLPIRLTNSANTD